jgi:hypothetical protein
MKKTVLTFGVISGVIASVLMGITVPFMEHIGYDKGLIVGYTGIVASLLLVFFGVRSYRESSGGHLTFGRGFTVGILITLISCAFYVASWAVVYHTFMPNFWDKFSAQSAAEMKAKGASQEAIDAQLRQIEGYKADYKNPFLFVAYTAMEPFPVGLLVTLISAVALRRRPAAAVASGGSR